MSSPSPSSRAHLGPTVPKEFLATFILITSCFALWGFANDITNPMVAAFQTILQTNTFQASLVQFAFYGGYCVMAIPAALFIKKFTYKAGIMMGLGLYAVGGLLFIPASHMATFAPFLLAYFVLTCGLSFLETSANPFILSMGPEETSTQRLNLAQSFNPIGSLTGMFVASNFILAKIDPTTATERALLPPAELAALTDSDLAIVRLPYVVIATVIIVMLLIVAFTKMPHGAVTDETDHSLKIGPSLRRLWSQAHYREGVVAQAFYVGAQIMCWTFIIQYGTRVFMELGLGQQAAQVKAQHFNIVAMGIFLVSRFVCTFLLKFIAPGRLLAFLAVAAAVLTLGVIFLQSITGLYCLVAISACMSLMFPTIYGIALKGAGEDSKFAAAGLIMAIGGGCLMPPLQGAIIDLGSVGSLPAVNASFVLPLVCFIVIAAYGYRALRHHA